MRLELRYHPFDRANVHACIYREGVLVAVRETTPAEAEALAERFDEQGLTVERMPFAAADGDDEMDCHN
jgi:hypothetical protein